MSTPRTRNDLTSVTPAPAVSSSKRSAAKKLKTTTAADVEPPTFDISKQLDFDRDRPEDEEVSLESPKVDATSDDQDPSDGENPDEEDDVQSFGSTGSAHSDRMRFYRSIVEKSSLSSFSLSDIRFELVEWAKHWANKLTAEQQTAHLDGVALLQQVMKLLNENQKLELAKRFIKSHATDTTGDPAMLQLASSCSLYLQHVHLLLEQDGASLYKSAHSRTQFLDHCSKPFVTNLLTVDAAPSEILSYKMELDATGHNRGWNKLWVFPATVPSVSRTTFNMLYDVKLLTEADIKTLHFAKSVFERDLSRCLFISMMATLHPLFKSELQMYQSVYGMCGVKLMFYVFRRCEERNARCTDHVTKLLDNLPKFFVEQSHNMHVICSHLLSRITDYKAAGNSTTRVYPALRSAFLSIKCSGFTQEINTWQTQHASSTRLREEFPTVVAFLKVIPEMMDKCIDDDTWPKDKLPIYGTIPRKNVRFSQNTSSPDIAVFRAELDTKLAAVDESLAAIQANVSTLSAPGNKKQRERSPKPPSSSTPGSSYFSTTPHKSTINGKDLMVWAVGTKQYRMVCGSGPYEYGTHQWGNKPGLYASAHDFLKFVSGACNKSTITYNAKPWFWCDKCGKLNGHSTQDHKAKGSTKKRKHQDGSSPGGPPSFSYSAITSQGTAAASSTTSGAPPVFDADADAHSLLGDEPSFDDE
jgi:hypothetical protein